ncbi:MAG: hypothetical protein A3H96_25910 [Acidobacteria bacterium RIFCSPLOWO2_02_FULL_67_36]|nr:MAG: hypothetical protein A3H96_25910 [Acidobacteria bacterium RIFCSPLOWO2_02_FULL_67_36]OFW22952.1 MAG: hypothetical protein A3G21_01425 [Acidobacteria bacterium RIFCSPLOWO2_12_FULL_66_21]
MAALVVAAGAGAALAPAAHGQTSRTVVRAPQASTRALQVLGGGTAQIGVTIRDAEPADVKGKESAAGAVIENVSADGPAEKAGIRKGDVVVEFDGERVRSARQFSRLVQETVPGRTVQAVLMRDSQRTTVSVTPRENDGFAFFGDRVRLLGDIGRDFTIDMPAIPVPPTPPARPAPPSPPTPRALPDIQSFIWRSGTALGVTVTDVSTQLAEYFGVKDGVLVTSVAEGSAAAKAGVKAGDVITAINGATVTDSSDLRRRTQRLNDGEEFTLTVSRDKKTLTLKGKVEDGGNRRTYRSIV